MPSLMQRLTQPSQLPALQRSNFQNCDYMSDNKKPAIGGFFYVFLSFFTRYLVSGQLTPSIAQLHLGIEVEDALELSEQTEI